MDVDELIADGVPIEVGVARRRTRTTAAGHRWPAAGAGRARCHRRLRAPGPKVTGRERSVRLDRPDIAALDGGDVGHRAGRAQVVEQGGFLGEALLADQLLGQVAVDTGAPRERVALPRHLSDASVVRQREQRRTLRVSGTATRSSRAALGRGVMAWESPAPSRSNPRKTSRPRARRPHRAGTAHSPASCPRPSHSGSPSWSPAWSEARPHPSSPSGSG